MGEDFKPSLHRLGESKFDGKVKADYDELTQYLTLSLAKSGKGVTYRGIVEDQKGVDELLDNLLSVIGFVKPAAPKEESVEVVETEEV